MKDDFTWHGFCEYKKVGEEKEKRQDGTPSSLQSRGLTMKENNMNHHDDNQEGALIKVANKALSVALTGFGPVKSAADLAAHFKMDKRWKNNDECINALIRSQYWRSGGTGFVTGLGGGTTLVVGGMAVDLASVLAINMRMAAAIAIIRGYDVEDDCVRMGLLLTAIGSSIEEALGNAGVQIGKAGCKALINKIPRHLLGRINKFLGKRLVTKFSQKGVIQLGKAVPFVGGFVGGAINVVGCRSIGKLACKAFPALAVA